MVGGSRVRVTPDGAPAVHRCRPCRWCVPVRAVRRLPGGFAALRSPRSVRAAAAKAGSARTAGGVRPFAGPASAARAPDGRSGAPDPVPRSANSRRSCAGERPATARAGTPPPGARHPALRSPASVKGLDQHVKSVAGPGDPGRSPVRSRRCCDPGHSGSLLWPTSGRGRLALYQQQRTPGSVQFRTGGYSPRPVRSQRPVDQVKFLDRR
ncbi:Hypothetical protein SCLAV_0682 [Streptomyces clavuligerus]|uniref:Uncharacterized protein n=1 Tax=Streptomyces clavuligerus TaxID=1901 RepID=E2PUD9_STRCL|nr:Hypothetical protein SCLAV_0682 [Streptomyces clavuligerus]